MNQANRERFQATLAEGSAFWIGSDHPFDLHEAYLRFRSPAGWTLADTPKQAQLYITADSRYKLWINGQFVGRGPARSYPSAQSVDRLDVAQYLQAGPNTVAIQVYQPGYSHFSYLHRGAAGLLLFLCCDQAIMLISDTQWPTKRDSAFSDAVPRVSIYGTGVEMQNLHLADEWTEPDYDDSEWAWARIVAPARGYPWTGLQLRTLPNLVERTRPLKLINIYSGQDRLSTEHIHEALVRGWKNAYPAAESVAVDDAGWYRFDLTFQESRYFLFDLGRAYTFQGWIEVQNASGEEQIAISYVEKMRDREIALSDPQTYCRVRLTDHFTLRQGAQRLEGFSMRGGRYLMIQVCGSTGEGFALQIHARSAEYPLTVTKPLDDTLNGYLDEPDPMIGGIIKLCEETMHACLQDGFVDCNWRESSQWLGDALPQSLIMHAMCDDVGPMRQSIEMAAQGAYPDGVLPSILPGEVHAYAVLDYNFTWVELLALYHELTADCALIQAMWPTLIKLLDRFDQDRGEDGLILSQPGRRLFLDWSPLSRQEPNAVYNLRYLLALQKAVHLASEHCMGDVAALDRWQSRAAQLQQAICENFWHNQRWYDDLERITFSQQAGALALLTGCVPEGEVAQLQQVIVERSLNLDDEPLADQMVLASPFMHHYIFEALHQRGQEGAVLEIIRRRWGRWVEAGYPTAWENWNVDFPDGSQCHGFSAHPRYHLSKIASILDLKLMSGPCAV